MRLHGDREPRQPQVGTTGGATCRSGAENEVWSFGKEAFEICKKISEPEGADETVYRQADEGGP